MRIVNALLVMFIAAASLAADSPWRPYSGGFSSRWHTVGPHGHDQPWCREPETIKFPDGSMVIHSFGCDGVDFERANLDNSIGFRAGRERDFLSLRPLKLVGGYEGAASFTEYNLSQTDFALLTGSLTAGADLKLFGARVGVRWGGGPFATTDGRIGVQYFRGYELSLPLRAGASLRISRRNVTMAEAYRDEQSGRLGDRLRANETSVMFAGEGPGGDSKWEFATTTGMTNPGLGPTQSLGLRSAPYHRLSIHREIGSRGTQAVATWTSSGHESTNRGIFRGFDGNYRSKTVNSFGLGAQRSRPLFGTLSVRYGGGLEIADWRDDYDLLKRSNGVEVKGGIETALGFHGAVRWNLGRGTALDFSGEQVYWTGIRLSEGRWGIGLVLTR